MTDTTTSEREPQTDDEKGLHNLQTPEVRNLRTLHEVGTAPDASEAQEAPQDAQETFPRAYVEKLRQEAAEARTRAKKADEYARELFAARVAATGRLADPTDLPFDAGHLDSPDALNAAIDALLDAKPHLASRVPRGNVGQGAGTASHDEVDLAALLRRGA